MCREAFAHDRTAERRKKLHAIELENFFRRGDGSTFLAAMANPVRLDVLIALSNGERDVGSLAQQLGIAQSALSQHLAKLRKPGLVKCRRDQKRILYFIADAKIPTMLWMFNTMFRS